ncbi:hypothetical protein A6R68_18383, partial [Neotoma lepida]
VDHNTIVDVLTNRSREQRQLISRAFQERTKQDLLKSLQAALSGNLEKIVVALLQPAAQFDAQELRTALKASGSAEDVALEILATRAAPRLQECLAVYKHDFQVEAKEDIRTETNGILQDLLLALSKGGRERYSGIIDYNLEEQDVQALQQTGGSSMAVLNTSSEVPKLPYPHPPCSIDECGSQWWGESPFPVPYTPTYLSNHSLYIPKVFDQYRRCTGQELEDAIRNCFHGDAQQALLSLGRYLLRMYGGVLLGWEAVALDMLSTLSPLLLASIMRNTALYFADKLHEALQETEPNFQVLIRVLISRSETDLLSIRAEFKKKFG